MTDPYLVIAVQLLDGISAAIFGILFALVVADITRDTGRFNLALGIVGSAIGIGASISTTFAGYLFDHFGHATTFLTLAGVAIGGSGAGLAADAGDAAGGELRRLWSSNSGRDPTFPVLRIALDSHGLDPLPLHLRGGAQLAHDVEPGRRRLHQAAVDRHIVLGHAAGGEALLEPLAGSPVGTIATAARRRRPRRPRPPR